MTSRDDLTEKLQSAIDAARDLARAAQAGAGTAELDQLAGMAVQKMAAFRGALRRVPVHLRTQLPEMDFDGPACLANGGQLTEDPSKVTCSKCAKHRPSS
jgi:hypothetical protein